MGAEYPRQLTQTEGDLLSLLLSEDFEGVEVLRDQARAAQVVGRCACGCPSAVLRVPPSVLRADGLSSRLVPVEGVVEPLGDELPGQIILLIDGGRLAYMEYVFVDTEPPADWPSLDRVSVVMHRP